MDAPEGRRAVKPKNRARKVYCDEYDENLYSLCRTTKEKIGRPLSRRDGGVWCHDVIDEIKVIHFACPRCSGINLVDQDDCYDAGHLEKEDTQYLSFVCHKCQRHLWVHFAGSDWFN
jgi:hypothetical protein